MIVAPLWKKMEPPDRKGQHVRHCTTHRNAFVQELGSQNILLNVADIDWLHVECTQKPGKN